jgi:hypothetical protein
MINIQDYINRNRTGKAGLRVAHITSGFSLLTLTPHHSAPSFSPSDQGKNIVVIGAGPGRANLYTTIRKFMSSTQVELAANASTSTPSFGAAVAWWDASQDDTAAFNNAQNHCAVGNGILYCPGDVYIISSTLVAAQNLQSLIGDGPGETLFVCTPSLTGNFLTVPDVPSCFSLGGGPTQGFAVLGPGFQTPATVTAWSVASHVATFTADNTFEARQKVLLQGFIGTTNKTANNTFVEVLASDLSNTQFKASLTAPDTLTIKDTGIASLNWNGIAFTSPGADWIGMGNIEIQAFAGDAVQLNDTIVSDFRKVIMSHCGQGFNDMPSTPAGNNGGTSLSFDTCYASGNYKAGYYVKSLAYSSFNNCAADFNGVAYYLDGAENVSFNGSGSEEQQYRNAAYPGYSYYFHGATSCALNCPYATSGPSSKPPSIYLVFDNGARKIFVSSFKANIAKDTTKANVPTDVLTIDNTCSDITIWEFEVSLPPGVMAKWTDGGRNDTIYFDGQFHTTIRGAAGAAISGASATLPTPRYTNSSSVAASDFLPLSAGWGDTASLAFVAGSFAMGSFQIKAGGAGRASNPTVTFKFPSKEVGSHNPHIVWSRFDGAVSQTGYWLVFSISPTQITWVFVGTPGAGENIGMQWIASSAG